MIASAMLTPRRYVIESGGRTSYTLAIAADEIRVVARPLYLDSIEGPPATTTSDDSTVDGSTDTSSTNANQTGRT